MTTRTAKVVVIHSGALDNDFTNYCNTIPKVETATKYSDHFDVVFTSDATTTDVSTAKNLMLNKFIETVDKTVEVPQQ